MQLNGLSKYDVHFTDDDRVRVYSKFYKSYITPRHINGSDKWQLQTDFGKSRHVTEGQLRFMRNHQHGTDNAAIRVVLQSIEMRS